MSKACFVSDLHLFANRSRGSRHLDAIRQTADRSQLCVLGGDIFDFKWSTLQSDDHSVEAAMQWLHELTASVPNCRVHFLLGNHDYHPGLIARLPALAQDLPNFEWERFFLRHGNTIFLHGDVADRKMTAACLERRRNKFRHAPRSPAHHRAYDLLVRTNVHAVLPHAVYPQRIVAARILSYLQNIGHGPETGVEHVYFGHTHRAVSGYKHRGLMFHNGGAPIGRARYRILELEIGGL